MNKPVFMLALLLLSMQAVFSQPKKIKKMNRILFVVTSHAEKGNTGQKTGYYLSEVSHAYEVLKEAGYAIDFVSPKGGQPPVDGYNLNDAVNKAFVEDAEAQASINHSMKPEAVDFRKYDAIYYAGGHGTMWDFADNQTLATIAARIYKNGGVVGAVCHGPAGLVNIRLSNGAYLVKGKKVAAFTNEEETAAGLTEEVPFLLETRLKERGALHIPAEKWQKNVQTDERLITGQNPASAKGVAEEMLKLLETVAVR
jgi:putative intracellular protease/amidase